MKKLLPVLKATGTAVVPGPGVGALGPAAGKDAAAAVGITDHALARGIRKVFDEEAAPAGAAGPRKATPRASAQKGFRRIG